MLKNVAGLLLHTYDHFFFVNYTILRRLAKRMAAMALKNSSELQCAPIASRLAPSSAITPVDWTSGEWSGEESENSQGGDGREGEESLITTNNEAMASLSEKTNIGKVSPLTFQLETGWNEATDTEKGKCIEKATKGCKVVCEVIAPNAWDQLFRSCVQLSDRTNENPSGDLLAIMQAYKNAPTGNLKTQILSLYAYTATLWKSYKSYTSPSKA